jgi:hypothetical protein
VPTETTISLKEAARIAEDAVAQQVKARVVSVVPELVYEQRDGELQLVYRVKVGLHNADTDHTTWRVWVSPSTGAGWSIAPASLD